MKRSLLSLTVATAIAITISTPALAAAKPTGGGSTTPLGNDISYPQCGKSLPSGQAFGIVGVNGGLANTNNSCLRTELTWAYKSVGGTPQDKAQLYVNTANPGGLGTASWPTSNTDPTGTIAPNPYNTCDGSDSLACAWQYGWNRSVEDVRDRFAPAAGQAGVSAVPSSYVWWLDIETTNTWKTGGTAFDYQSNIADIEGMTAYFKSVGGRVGLYSTSAQWSQIVSSYVTSGSNLNGLPNWRPGGASLNTAKDACKAAPLTSGGSVVLTQYIAKNVDTDYSCI